MQAHFIEIHQVFANKNKVRYFSNRNINILDGTTVEKKVNNFLTEYYSEEKTLTI